MAWSRRVSWVLGAVLLAGCTRSELEGVPAAEPRTQTDSDSAALVAEPFTPESGFALLTLADFTPFPTDAQSWHEERGVIVCSGQPKGYLFSRESFGNFTWRGEFRFQPLLTATPENLAKSNTGFMIHIQEPHKVWPRSLEVQGRHDEVASIKSNGGVPALVVHDHPEVRTVARSAAGVWSAFEIVSRDGALTARLNGQVICESDAGELRSGLLGLQSELYEVHFRNLRIRRE